ncbi:MAG TPA: OmpA family protein, partial [Candidatus Hydrogenedentes bacterium]|nr:OmpA family protein [Candidatus Hydrogenedentota bacterium]
DKAVLKPEGKAVVDQVVAEMKAHGKDTVVIEGHTCDLGSDEYNMGLGQRRADAVKSYMLENGIDASRVSTKSLGETTPAQPNDSAANRKLNRRAQFDITIVNE